LSYSGTARGEGCTFPIKMTQCGESILLSDADRKVEVEKEAIGKVGGDKGEKRDRIHKPQSSSGEKHVFAMKSRFKDARVQENRGVGRKEISRK